MMTRLFFLLLLSFQQPATEHLIKSGPDLSMLTPASPDLS